ncbi:MAG: response regulator transcription factor, partial [Clostridia bacterium]|nr:response regulator transcription factor [Clostridia bacterium]
LVLMDVMMPVMDGIVATAKIRERSNVPIILLTAKSETEDLVLGLNVGADDYITKPFSVRELIARVKALLRRSTPQNEEEGILHVGGLTIDVGNYEAFRNGEKLSLTLKEFELLKLLVMSRGKVLTRDFLLDRIWGYEFYGETRTVDVHIRHIRQKLGDDAHYIETIRGVGYKFNDRQEKGI